MTDRADKIVGWAAQLPSDGLKTWLGQYKCLKAFFRDDDASFRPPQDGIEIQTANSNYHPHLLPASFPWHPRLPQVSFALRISLNVTHTNMHLLSPYICSAAGLACYSTHSCTGRLL